MHYGIIVVAVAIAIVVMVLVGGPILENIFDGQVWLKANLARERTTQFYAFLFVMTLLILGLGLAGFLAYMSHQRHQENIALITARNSFSVPNALPQPRHVNIYVGPGQSRHSAYTRALDAGLVLETDEVHFINTRDAQERGLVTYDNQR